MTANLIKEKFSINTLWSVTKFFLDEHLRRYGINIRYLSAYNFKKWSPEETTTLSRGKISDAS